MVTLPCQTVFGGENYGKSQIFCIIINDLIVWYVGLVHIGWHFKVIAYELSQLKGISHSRVSIQCFLHCMDLVVQLYHAWPWHVLKTSSIFHVSQGNFRLSMVTNALIYKVIHLGSPCIVP